MAPHWLLVLSAVLFTLGAFGVLWNRGAITILMCVQIMLNAQYVALLQIIVYAGAIMVLILFVIMLLNLPAEARLRGSGFFQGMLAPVFGLACAAILGRAVYRGTANAEFEVVASDFGQVGNVGFELFSRFYYPFEAISLLLIVAMIGAVLLAKRRL